MERRPSSRPAPLRFTGRGRVVLLGLGLLLVGFGAGAATPGSAAPADLPADPVQRSGTSESPAPAEPSEPSEVAVVRPGDTLWSVVARHAPGRDPYGIIEEVRRLNDLPDHTIHPGQELVLP